MLTFGSMSFGRWTNQLLTRRIMAYLTNSSHLVEFDRIGIFADSFINVSAIAGQSVVNLGLGLSILAIDRIWIESRVIRHCCTVKMLESARARSE